jgi:hypothetical protein
MDPKGRGGGSKKLPHPPGIWLICITYYIIDITSISGY